MAKTYTDLEQSKKLAEILPIESADMCFNISVRKNMPPLMTPYSRFNEFFDISPTPDFLIPCWSLAALLDVLPKNYYRYTKSLYWFDDSWHCEYVDEDGAGILGTSADNVLDACYGMILKLHEQNFL